MKRSLVIALLTVALSAASILPAFAAEPTHDMVLLRLDSPTADAFMQAHAAQLDIAKVKKGHYAEIVVTPETMELIRQSGLQFEVTIKDLENHYASRSRGVGFGIYHTYSENVAFQDSLRLLYPHVVSEKWSIGQTHNGLDIFAFRVSANPDIDEDEPEILIDGMHHAREIMASEFPIMFAEYLAQNYGTDPEITWLLDNRELYIVPIVNPDGVTYNELTDPNGGGQWRKNRRNNGDGTYGVDPNRNYPFQWGYDNNGSSGYTGDLTYRGPSAGSEPEIQAMMDFINSRHFITHDTVHTYSNLLLYPWGYNNQPTADEDTYVHMAAEMTKFNGYEAGRPGDILYNVNGGTFDWAYGDGSHQGFFSFSSEIGSSGDGFWPSEARRQPLFEENIWPHIYLMRVAGPFVAAHSLQVAGQGGPVVHPGQSGFIDFTVENQSVVASSLAVSVTVRTDDPFIQLEAAEFDLGSLASLSSTTLGAGALPFSVDPACPDGHSVEVTVSVDMGDGIIDYPLSFFVGSPSVVFGDDLESGTGNWSLAGSWGATTSQSYSPSYSLTDSPSGDYANQTVYSAVLDGSYQATELSFWHRYEIEDGWDFARVQISADGGPWTSLTSYTGNLSTWQQVSLDLSNYAGQELSFRFMMETDYSVRRDGWYIDDIQIIGAGSDNLAPATPLVMSPADGSNVGASPSLIVSSVTDPEGSPVTYGFRIYSDELCTQLTGSTDNLVDASWTAGPLTTGQYWWRAYAGDGEQRSLLSPASLINVTTTTGVDDFVISGTSLNVLDRVSGGQARIQLGVPSNTKVALDIYDMRGAKVRQLYSGVMNAGTRVLTWDGRDDSGRSTASGMYFLRMQAGNEVRTGRVVVVR